MDHGQEETAGSKGIRGGRQQKIQERMNCPENDHVLVVDEYNTTKTCGSCLHLVELQWQRQEDGTYRRCKGAGQLLKSSLSTSTCQ